MFVKNLNCYEYCIVNFLGNKQFIGNNAFMEFIDAHLHFGGREDEILGSLDAFTQLRNLGLTKVFLLCFTTYGLDFSDTIRVAPYHARSHYHPGFVDSNPLLEKVRQEIEYEDFIVPFLDFRIIHGDVESWLDHYMASGYRGLKTLFIPEYDSFLKVESPIEILKITKDSYLDSQQRVMDYAQRNNLPLICHLNLNNHFEYAREFLANFPHLRINFPHLGFSRKKMGLLLDNFENCYSDISGLMEYIKNDPKGYCEYIEYYEDQIMYGSDCAWNEAVRVEDDLNMIEGLPLDDVSRKKLVCDTALKSLENK